MNEIAGLEADLKVVTAKLGPDHHDTLCSQHHLGYVYMRLGRYTDAVAVIEPTVDRRERTLGPEHPETLASRHNLGVAHHYLQHRQTAIAILEQTLGARERVLGLDHRDTVTTRTSLENVVKSRPGPHRR